MALQTPYQRYHHPDQPIKRSLLQKTVIWLLEYFLTFLLFYFLSLNPFHSFYSYTVYGLNPGLIYNFRVFFWISMLLSMWLVKIFRPTAVFFGVLSGELLLEVYYTIKWQPIFLIYICIFIFVESRHPYRGEEFYRGNFVLKQIGLTLLHIIVFLPILYFGFQFYPEIPSEYTPASIRFYICLNFSTNLFLITPLFWIGLWILDRVLAPFFPLSTTETAPVDHEQHPSLPVPSKEKPQGEISDNQENVLIPQPGELYHHFLTHHPLDQDNHTIVVLLGKVRVYLCTRCTAMILGVIIMFFLPLIFLTEWQLIIPSYIALILVIITPLFPLTDWGLQALLIRPATTRSRLFTGFILGADLALITYAAEYVFIVLIVIVVYFVIFGILTWLRVKIGSKKAAELALIEHLQDSSLDQDNHDSGTDLK